MVDFRKRDTHRGTAPADPEHNAGDGREHAHEEVRDHHHDDPEIRELGIAVVTVSSTLAPAASQAATIASPLASSSAVRVEETVTTESRTRWTN